MIVLRPLLCSIVGSSAFELCFLHIIASAYDPLLGRKRVYLSSDRSIAGFAEISACDKWLETQSDAQAENDHSNSDAATHKVKDAEYFDVIGYGQTRQR